MKTCLTAERLRELLGYDPNTGEFVWLLKRNQHVGAGSKAGALDAKGYRVITVDGRDQKAHRLAWLYVHGEWPPDDIDHINGIRSDNRIANLRKASRGQNVQNIRRARKDSRSGLIGAHYRKDSGTYAASIQVNGLNKHLGHFKTAEEAHAAYLKAKAELHPFSTMPQGATA
jgi:hypothetical protein